MNLEKFNECSRTPRYPLRPWIRGTCLRHIRTRKKSLRAPLEIRGARRSASGKSDVDGVVRIAWQGREVEFQVEVKSRTAPKIVQEAFSHLRSWSLARRKTFLLVVPYITPRIREMVEDEGVNCLDLNGNYLIQNPEFLAIRLDRKNRFPESAPIKKIFSGNSSQVGRLFLGEKRIFKSVGEVFDAINRAGGGLSLSTVSKVLSGLADELIIEKEKSSDRIVLLQPEKLLDRLQEGYAPPNNFATLKLKIPGAPDEVLKILSSELTKDHNIWMLGGESSADRYAMTTPPAVLRVYSPKVGDLSRYENTRFFNVVIERRTERYIFFDRQTSPKDDVCWASRFQTYLELSSMDKREREIAVSIRGDILKAFKV